VLPPLPLPLDDPAGAVPVPLLVGQVAGVDPVLVLLVLGLAALGVAIAYRRWLQHKQADLLRLAERDGLRPTPAPCGMTADELAAGFTTIPRGDRRFGLEYALTGPLAITLAGDDHLLECSSFRWWWEERQTTTSRGSSSSRYVRQRQSVTLLRLPVPVQARLTVRPESLLGRVGLTRGGHQLESSEFNRRFRVEARDRTLTVHLLDARLQQLLTDEFAGRSVEVVGDLLVLGGRPAHRDGSLTGFVGEIPAMRQDVRRLLAAVPAAFWRQVRLTPEED
jgi:hypothetical protein